MRICGAAAVVLAVVFFMSAPGRAQFPPAPGTGPGLAETIEAIDSARVTTRILYVTAHPDDESAAVLTYLARGLHADVALLSLTRGEGGQNALGPEQAPQLGLIRTQELLAATRGYGVKLYFTRAKDFGYSKTPEETEKIWGDQVLDDMVRIIRTFRPNVVINNWGGVHGGHGHHQAAGLLTPKAVAMAADEKAFSDQFKEGLTAWGGAMNDIPILDLDRFSDKPTGYVLPLDDVSPLWGKTWREIGMDAFANHKTQGVAVFFGNAFFRRPIALKREDGKPFDPQILSQSLDQFARVESQTGCSDARACRKAIDDADASASAAREAALALNWRRALELLESAQEQMTSLYPTDASPSAIKLKDSFRDELDFARSRFAKAAQLTAGFEVDAIADTPNVVLGESFDIKVSHRCRTSIDCGNPRFLLKPEGTRIEKKDESGAVQNFTAAIDSHSSVASPIERLEPFPPSLLFVTQHAGGGGPISGTALFDSFSVTHIARASTHVEKVPLRIVPAYALTVEPKQAIESLAGQHKPLDVYVRVHSYSLKAAEVSVGLELPYGWKSSNPVKVSFVGQGDKYAKLTATPPQSLQPGRFLLTAYAKGGDEKFSTSLEPLPSLPTLLWEEPAQCVVHAFDINVPKSLKVGYITAESEPVSDSLRMLGIQVDLLDAAALNFGDLSKYDAIVVGVRAYELRSELPGANQRLLDYVSNGGTLVVQYERDFAWDGKNYAPYPTKIDGGPGGQLPRITDETAAVNFLKPQDSLLNRPNKITAKDFDGWVQERGLYYWTDFDTTKYTPLLSMHDPGEKDLNGGLVYTKLGKGTYIYTGLAFFRQLPEGVPGAYRLFVNLLSASRSQ